jgi:hypothetical protein
MVLAIYLFATFLQVSFMNLIQYAFLRCILKAVKITQKSLRIDLDDFT